MEHFPAVERRAINASIGFKANPAALQLNIGPRNMVEEMVRRLGLSWDRMLLGHTVLYSPCAFNSGPSLHCIGVALLNLDNDNRNNSMLCIIPTNQCDVGLVKKLIFCDPYLVAPLYPPDFCRMADCYPVLPYDVAVLLCNGMWKDKMGRFMSSVHNVPNIRMIKAKILLPRSHFQE